MIEIQEDIDTGCGTILADPTQLQQIIVNLCTNSLHAIVLKEIYPLAILFSNGQVNIGFDIIEKSL